MVHGTMKPEGVSASPSIRTFLINLCCSHGCECKQTVICPDTLDKRFICIWIVICEQSVYSWWSRSKRRQDNLPFPTAKFFCFTLPLHCIAVRANLIHSL